MSVQNDTTEWLIGRTKIPASFSIDLIRQGLVHILERVKKGKL